MMACIIADVILWRHFVSLVLGSVSCSNLELFYVLGYLPLRYHVLFIHDDDDDDHLFIE